ncbi:MAG: long-chain-acyl-CoA synthetase, partial [Candidatus Thorarchaeota archaeon]
KNHTLKTMLGVGLRKDVWIKFKERFKIEHIYEFYGATEGHRTLINVDEVPGMIGKITALGMYLIKCNPETGELLRNEKGFGIKCKKPGDIGMALMKLDKETIFTGYKDKDKTQKKIIHDVLRKGDTYFNSGDMMKLHENKWVSFVDRLGDTYRWKSENVSTLEVEEILNSYPAINISSVYGVQVKDSEGRAGMAAIELNPSIKFDLNGFSKFVVEVLPHYAIPVFIRTQEKIEVTGPFKLIKVNIRNEGFDIKKINDPMYFWDYTMKKYVPLDESIYQEIIQGRIRL